MTQTIRGAGATVLCAVLERLGVRAVFGLPGSETIELFEALRRSRLRTVLTTDERAAAFMANGYFRASGNIAAVTVIGGPGFTNALTGLAEASHDSAGMICLVVGSDRHPQKKFRLQAIDHQNVAAPLVKSVVRIAAAAELPQRINEAYARAATGEPGPVVVEISSSALTESAELPGGIPRGMMPNNPEPSGKQAEEAIEQLARSARVVLYVGQGAAGAAEQVIRLAESLHCPVMSTCSGRGTIPESHPLSFHFDFGSGWGGETINNLLHESDLIIALGCKFTHNGTGGFRLKIPPEKLIHVDASAEVLGANYPARLTVRCDVRDFLETLERYRERLAVRPGGWAPQELETWRQRLQTEKHDLCRREPVISAEQSATCAAFFSALRAALPDDSCVVTDAGLHQTLTRRYFEVRCPRGLIVPTDFQSMGFGIPAAVGAKLAAPERPVVAIVGDGGFAMSGMELSTIVRERIPLVVVVFNDGKLGSIRLMQFEHTGWEHAVTLHNPDYAVFAESLGVSHVLWDPASPGTLADAVRGNETMLIEVPLVDSPEYRRLRTAARARAAVRRTVGPRWIRRLKRLLGR